MARECGIDGCERSHHARGLCSMHLQRQRRNGDPTKVIRLRGATLEERLWFKTRVVGDCWVFDGTVIHYDRGDGRGNYMGINIGRSMTGVHVASYREFVGPIPDGWHVHHTCGTKECWRPEHLQVMTASEHWHLHHPRQDVCPQGHELTDENVYVATTGQRVCRACQRQWNAEYRKRRASH